MIHDGLSDLEFLGLHAFGDPLDGVELTAEEHAVRAMWHPTTTEHVLAALVRRGRLERVDEGYQVVYRYKQPKVRRPGKRSRPSALAERSA